MDENALQKHKREMFRRIILPVLIPVLLLILVAVILFVLAMTDTLTGRQIGVMAAILVVVFVLLPFALIMLGLNAALLYVAFSAGRLPSLAAKPLELARQYTEKGAELTRTHSERLTTPIITTRSKLARWRYTVSGIIKKDG
ncbi:MAG: hypothetical protein KJ064_14750 [Anaerolineae bacterium]|jgi:hypothetical protein|nr:MAG: hypothetical protein F9K27_11090 [Anaerolineae bacterium]MCL4877913.1 hypothetical protein [Anaerolineae bacterium]